MLHTVIMHKYYTSANCLVKIVATVCLDESLIVAAHDPCSSLSSGLIRASSKTCVSLKLILRESGGLLVNVIVTLCPPSILAHLK